MISSANKRRVSRERSAFCYQWCTGVRVHIHVNDADDGDVDVDLLQAPWQRRAHTIVLLSGVVHDRSLVTRTRELPILTRTDACKWGAQGVVWYLLWTLSSPFRLSPFPRGRNPLPSPWSPRLCPLTYSVSTRVFARQIRKRSAIDSPKGAGGCLACGDDETGTWTRSEIAR